MIVRFITVSNDRHRRIYRHELDAALISSAYGDEFSRIAFGGRTPEGRAGIVLEVFDSKITGHKIDAIPPELHDLVVHFPLSGARDGLKRLVEGDDVLIGTPDHGVLIRRYGNDFEVFGTGDDSARSSP